MDRDALYRDCALQIGLVQPVGTDDTGRTFEDDGVDRVPGGAWVSCVVYISNGEVVELLSRERKERRIEAERRVEAGRAQGLDAAELAELHTMKGAG